jgi:hypothetical protein
MLGLPGVPGTEGRKERSLVKPGGFRVAAYAPRRNGFVGGSTDDLLRGRDGRVSVAQPVRFAVSQRDRESLELADHLA